MCLCSDRAGSRPALPTFLEPSNRPSWGSPRVPGRQALSLPQARLCMDGVCSADAVLGETGFSKKERGHGNRRPFQCFSPGPTSTPAGTGSSPRQSCDAHGLVLFPTGHQFTEGTSVSPRAVWGLLPHKTAQASERGEKWGPGQGEGEGGRGRGGQAAVPSPGCSLDSAGPTPGQ